MVAAMHNFKDIVQALLVANANIHQHDKVRPCHSYRSQVRYGIFLRCTGQFGRTALVIAAARGRTAIVKVLLRAGANADMRTEVSKNPSLKLVHRNMVGMNR
jgi:ankyrin repeat protein